MSRLEVAARAYLESRRMVVDLTVAARDAARMSEPKARFLDDQLGAWAEHDEDCRRELMAALEPDVSAFTAQDIVREAIAIMERQ